MFLTTKRTGKYRIVKVTDFNDEVHYELQWETIAVVGGMSWETVMHELRPIKFSTEDEALSYANDGAQIREVVREGDINV
jgi:hypothetical protein